jgi:hypothetical protein
MKPLVIAILVKSKAPLLHLYLESILSQTAIDENTIFYIRTNDNKDNTADILREWCKKWSKKWKIYFDDSSVNSSITDLGNKEWTFERLRIMGELRNKSIEFAISENADYFTVDADILLKPHTIDTIRNLNLPVIAPMVLTLEPSPAYEYTNLHYAICENGFFREHPDYHRIHNQEIIGIFKVPVVHCSYHIKNEILPEINYLDDSGRYEYIIFSDFLRRKGIDQYFDNREIYGRFCSAETEQHIIDNYNSNNFVELIEYIKKSPRFSEDN